jgi:hypothetical protein
LLATPGCGQVLLAIDMQIPSGVWTFGRDALPRVGVNILTTNFFNGLPIRSRGSVTLPPCDPWGLDANEPLADPNPASETVHEPCANAGISREPCQEERS